MRGNLIPAGLDGLAAMDRRHHYHQHIGSAVDLYWYYSGLAIWATYVTQHRTGHPDYRAVQLRHTSHQ